MSDNTDNYEKFLKKMKQDLENPTRDFYKEHKRDKVWWIDTSDYDGVFEFSFDKKKVFNLFRDYPYKLTKEQKEIFDRENPFWADFFKRRSEGKE